MIPAISMRRSTASKKSSSIGSGFTASACLVRENNVRGIRLSESLESQRSPDSSVRDRLVRMESSRNGAFVITDW